MHPRHKAHHAAMKEHARIVRHAEKYESETYGHTQHDPGMMGSVKAASGGQVQTGGGGMLSGSSHAAASGGSGASKDHGGSRNSAFGGRKQ